MPVSDMHNECAQDSPHNETSGPSQGVRKSAGSLWGPRNGDLSRAQSIARCCASTP
ncbi:hypothetical protein GT037_008806 [Alternaria burnsii]|uniref:Uncharacterized protein n=1 Tax=Alternaria burnsii TaxID=1187904 RepID=A0A8H7B2P6_9PLEO|nr:uncharacterized protein GT037_011261 [Alternaria burnsii]XP_038783818.1 uncharacterized protein GT037_008806 [Alternaria burnsii]KAF7670682.1 hypothetical protein GT037_011261 [Alternaria burnsii]KAF7673483.1 hypothetical protein GT037_008806 [Alternaria burnsii]